MAYPRGGRGDKYGNDYETNFMIYQLLRLLDNEISGVTREPVGEDEESTDVIIYENGEKIFCQCKGRNGSSEVWEYYNIKEFGLFKSWKNHLERDPKNLVRFVSPISCTILSDLIKECKNTSGDFQRFEEMHLKNASSKMQHCFDALSEEFNLDKVKDIQRLINFLTRIEIVTFPESSLNEFIKLKCNKLFSSNHLEVIGLFRNYIAEEDINGKILGFMDVHNYLIKNNVIFLNLSMNPNNNLKIMEINDFFIRDYKMINGEIINRLETTNVFSNIRENKHVILYGNAGFGKSGVIRDFIDKLKLINIPFLAINLETYQPIDEPDAYGKSMGLLASPVLSLDSISKQSKSILIIDQLDSIKWYNKNSKKCITNLKRMINEVEMINHGRLDNQISIVMVVRTYDLNNDISFKDFFDNSWVKINVNTLKESDINRVLGDEYNSLTVDLRKLLTIPNNLYIYTQLNDINKKNNYKSSSSLMKRWIEQICVGFDESNLNVEETLDLICNKMSIENRNCFPYDNKGIDNKVLNYLLSSNIIIKNENSIMFSHQSIFDYLLSNNLLQEYKTTRKINGVIGNKANQTPNNRYRLQLMLQSLIEIDQLSFLDFGKKMLRSHNIKKYYKILFQECLNSIENPSKIILEFIKENFNNIFIKNACIGNASLSKYLVEKDYLLINELKKGDTDYIKRFFYGAEVISINYSSFLRKIVLENSISSESILEFLPSNFLNDDDDTFQYRCDYLRKNPSYFNRLYFDINMCLNEDDIKTVELISIAINHYLNQGNSSKIEHFFDELDPNEVTISHPVFVLEKLIKYIPFDCTKYSEWVNFGYGINIQRMIVDLIKLSNKVIAKTDPQFLFDFYKPYFSKEYELFKELIIYSFSEIEDTQFSNQIILYVATNLSCCIESTSGNDYTFYLKKALLKHLSYACDENVQLFNDILYKYTPEDFKDEYKLKRQYQQFYPIWGKLQYDIIEKMDDCHLTSEMKLLKKELIRKYGENKIFYFFNHSYSGSIISPVHKKKLSFKNWISIINNPKIGKKPFGQNFKNGCFYESTLREFSRDFEIEVETKPNEYIIYFLNNNMIIACEYIQSFFIALSKLDVLDIISYDEMICLINKYIDYSNENLVLSIIRMLEKIEDKSKIDIKFLAQVFENYCKSYSGNIYGEYDYNSYMLNSVFGEFSLLLSKCLWVYNSVFDEIFSILEYYITSNDDKIKYCSINILLPITRFNKEFAINKILDLYKDNTFMMNHYDSYRILQYLYYDNCNMVIEILERYSKSKESQIKKQVFYSATACYLLSGKCKHIVYKKKYDKDCISAVMEIVEAYLRESPNKVILKRCSNLLIYYSSKYENYNYLIFRLIKGKKLDIKNNKKLINKTLFDSKKMSKNLNILYELEDYDDGTEALVNKYLFKLTKLFSKTDNYHLSKLSKIIIAYYDKAVAINDKVQKRKLLNWIDKLYCKGSCVTELNDYITK